MSLTPSCSRVVSDNQDLTRKTKSGFSKTQWVSLVCAKVYHCPHHKNKILESHWNVWCGMLIKSITIYKIIILRTICYCFLRVLKHDVGGRHEALRPWQRSWGRRLNIRKGGIEPQESCWKSSSIYPHNQSLPTLLLCVLPYTSDFMGGCPLPPLSEKALT